MTAAEIVESYGIASKWCSAIMTICLMILCMYLIWTWYKVQVQKEKTARHRSSRMVKQTEIAWRHLEQDQSERYEKEIKQLRIQIARLEKEKKDISLRLETFLKTDINRKAQVQTIDD